MPLFAALILVGVSAARGLDADKAANPDQEVMRLEREWSDAIVKREVKVIDRILADDYTLITPEGQMVPKPKILDSFRAPPSTAFVVKTVAHDRMSVRIYGDTAVVTFRFTLKGEARGREVEAPFRHTDVFVKDHGQWRCVVRQATRVVEEYDHPG
jgi:ketosteroid isomerase-like protein